MKINDRTDTPKQPAPERTKSGTVVLNIVEDGIQLITSVDPAATMSALLNAVNFTAKAIILTGTMSGVDPETTRQVLLKAFAQECPEMVPKEAKP